MNRKGKQRILVCGKWRKQTLSFPKCCSEVESFIQMVNLHHQLRLGQMRKKKQQFFSQLSTNDLFQYSSSYEKDTERKSRIDMNNHRMVVWYTKGNKNLSILW